MRGTTTVVVELDGSGGQKPHSVSTNKSKTQEIEPTIIYVGAPIDVVVGVQFAIVSV